MTGPGRLPELGPLPAGGDRDWARHAINLLQGDGRRSADTHLVKPAFRGLRGVSVYLKDESTHPTGSLKHRLARSLFLYGICNGRIDAKTTLVEASSGSTAVSEAYFAELLGLPFIAVMPQSTSRAKVEAIERFGGACHFVEHAAEVYQVARAWRRRPAATTSTSSPTPSAPPTGGATTTSPKASSARCRARPTRSPTGW